MKQIEKMRKSFVEAGVLSMEDIDEICRLEKEFAEECEKIADECTAEGYPSHGTNYDLRCANIRESYDEEINLILDGYEF